MNPKPNIDQRNLLFQIKNKQKWTPKDTHHNVSTFMDYVQNDLSEEKTEKDKKNNNQQFSQRGTKSNGRSCKEIKKGYNYIRI